MHRNRNMSPPVKVGDEVEVTIEAVGEKGDGIAKVKGFILFVPGTKQGEHVKIKISKVFNKMGFADVVERLEKSAETDEPMEVLPEPEPEPDYEDSEDFGEDSDDSED